jgi:hypothetical protein
MSMSPRWRSSVSQRRVDYAELAYWVQSWIPTMSKQDDE